MNTHYNICKAPQGTNDQEIAKAKRVYRKGVKTGKYPKVSQLLLQFSDINNTIHVNFMDTIEHNLNDTVAL